MKPVSSNRRILVVDDHPGIQADFGKILAPPPAAEAALSQAEAELFSADANAPAGDVKPVFELAFASQGQEALEKVRAAEASQLPFALAFVDVRMPPGWDGIETTARLWEVNPHLEIVICTAHTDYSWQEMLKKLPYHDRFLVLKKPFESIEVLQLAQCLTAKWQWGRQAELRQAELEEMVRQRTESLQQALANVKTLSGLLPICASCKKIRDDTGYWSQVEAYVAKYSEARFTHGICPDCIAKLFGSEYAQGNDLK